MAGMASVRDTGRANGEASSGGAKDCHVIKKVVARGKERLVSPEVVHSLGEYSQCVEHQHRQDELQRIGHFLSATLDALAAHIVVLDNAGTIVAANAAWRNFAKDNQGDERTCGVGNNYLSTCLISAEHGVAEAGTVVTGIRHVLSRQQKEFRLTYACHSPTEERWFTMRVSGFENDGTTWAVVTHEDVTSLQKREQAVKQRRMVSLAECILSDRHFSSGRYRALRIYQSTAAGDLRSDIRRKSGQWVEPSDPLQRSPTGTRGVGRGNTQWARVLS
jgi:hypothetical protein